MADRFQLETDITALHNLSDDLDVLAEALLESDISREDVANALLGMSTMVRLRVDKAFNTFKAVFKLDEYSPEQQKYQREY